MELDEMTESEMRIELARKVGYKPSSMIKKPQLNSILGYLNGKWEIPQDSIYKPEQPNLLELRKSVARRCNFSYDQEKHNQPQGPKFDKSQVKEILRCVREEEDKRPFVEER